MNISQQLNLLQNIKESLKTKLLEIGAKIDDKTPFSQYSEFIKNAEKTVYTDSYSISTHKKDKTSIIISDNYSGSSHAKDKTDLNIIESVEVYRFFQNPAMTSNSMDGWEASANYANSGNEAYRAFNKNMTSENCWWTGSGNKIPCWVSLSFDTLYKIRSVEVMQEIASPDYFKDFLIQFRTSNEAEWETLYTVNDFPRTAGYSETFLINSNTAYKEFRLYITGSYGTTASIQNINIYFKD